MELLDVPQENVPASEETNIMLYVNYASVVKHRINYVQSIGDYLFFFLTYRTKINLGISLSNFLHMCKKDLEF